MTTHYTDADDRRRYARALCGRLVSEQHGEIDLRAPTCERCQAILKARDEEPLPSWARETRA